MTPFQHPLVALSISDPDAELLRYAATALAPFSVPVRFVHILPAGADGTPLRLQALREAIHAEVVQHAPALADDAMIEVRQDARIDGLLRCAAEYEHDLIVLGHRRGRSGRRSLARRLAMMAPSSVWLVPQGSPNTLREIIVPTDLSAHSADALAVATRIAATQGLSSCTALHVRFDPSLSEYPEHVEEFRHVEEDDFHRFIATADTGNVQVNVLFEDSARPALAILRVAERTGTDLIVMNTRGRSAAAAVLLGSVTSDVMAATHLPVLAVKHFGHRMSLRDVLTSGRLWKKPDPKTG